MNLPTRIANINSEATMNSTLRNLVQERGQWADRRHSLQKNRYRARMAVQGIVAATTVFLIYAHHNELLSLIQSFLSRS